MYKYRGRLSPSTKINSIFDYHRGDIPEIKLKRTDTTLDLSQKAKRAKEKKKKLKVGGWASYRISEVPGKAVGGLVSGVDLAVQEQPLRRLVVMTSTIFHLL